MKGGEQSGKQTENRRFSRLKGGRKSDDKTDRQAVEGRHRRRNRDEGGGGECVRDTQRGEETQRGVKGGGRAVARAKRRGGGGGCARVACSVGGGVDQEGRGGGRERNKWGPTQSCRERHSGRTLTTDASLARLASPRSFSLLPLPPFSSLSSPPPSLSSSPSRSNTEPSRARRTISLTLSVARDTCVPLFRLSNAQSLALVRALLHFRYEFSPFSSHCSPRFFLFLS